MEKIHIAFLRAAWHEDIVGECYDSFVENMGDAYEISVFTVPGSLEIPLMAKKLAASGEYAAVCCAGFVVNGGIYRHEFVAHAVLQGMMNAQLDTGVPILSAVLTPQEEFAEDGSKPEQHKFFFEHMKIKGKELAEACQATVENHAALE